MNNHRALNPVLEGTASLLVLHLRSHWHEFLLYKSEAPCLHLSCGELMWWAVLITLQKHPKPAAFKQFLPSSTKRKTIDVFQLQVALVGLPCMMHYELWIILIHHLSSSAILVSPICTKMHHASQQGPTEVRGPVRSAPRALRERYRSGSAPGEVGGGARFE